ncbi:MAG TPA: YHS domain-containing protein [Polyangiaceae bacterium]|nr:YHS domain-containing protein [Polyangiaceae bacterium]
MSVPTDPVCGKAVDAHEHPLQVTYDAQDFFFCSRECLQSFEREPQKFAARTAKSPLTQGKT